MKRTTFLILVLALAVLGLNCSGGGGGGGSAGNSLLGTWERTSATSSPTAAVRMTFSGNDSGGTAQATQLNGVTLTAQWSLSGSTLRIFGGDVTTPFTNTVQFVDANNFRLIQSDGTSTWRRS